MVGPFTGTFYFLRLGFPHSIVVVLFSNEGVGDFVKEGVADISIRSILCKIEGDR